MAISKIMHMKDGGSTYHGQHLRRSICYITDPEKTQGGKWIQSYNCTVLDAYEEMRETKKRFGKEDKRQGYHLVISFKEGEATLEQAMEITGKFVKSYLGKEYEAIFAVHDDTSYVHSHIVFNSVSFLHGKKYHYSKGDWTQNILPIVNQLCKEYGLSILEIGDEKIVHEGTKRERTNQVHWNQMVRRDLDACIIEASCYEDFLERLRQKGYEIKNDLENQGKYLAIKHLSMERYRRCKTLGDKYSQEMIRQRICKESLEIKETQGQIICPRILFSPKGIPVKRANITGLQKQYFAKLYRTGKLKKRAYSEVWKYKDAIKNMHHLQKQYDFLRRKKITSSSELCQELTKVQGQREAMQKESKQFYQSRYRHKPLFEIIKKMEALEEAEICYQNGENFFSDEHTSYQDLENQLKAEGYTLQEVRDLRSYYQNRGKDIRQKVQFIKMEEKVVTSIWRELEKKGEARQKMEKQDRERRR